MRLAEYLSTHDISNSAFAETIGVSVQALSRYRLGQRRPEWDVLDRIRIATDGAVTPNDFLELTDPSTPAEAAGAA